MQTAAIKIDDVVFRYFKNGKRNILDHVSLAVESGKITVIAGASGSGKSTLAAVISGLYPENGGFLESGKIELFGKELSSLKIQERTKLLSMMFQNADLQFCMQTLRREMRFCLENICVPKEQMDLKIEKALEILKLNNLADRKLCELSGGEKQKAALACLFVLESRCIILDESFANLDEKSSEELLNLVIQLKKEGRTIVAIDHKIELWTKAADEIIVLGNGAKVLERNINKDNIKNYKDLFIKEGLFFPGNNYSIIKESEQEAEPALSFKNLSIKTEDKILLSGADAVFIKGRMTAVLGPSGSGKTTTFNAVLQQQSYKGDIFLEQKNLKKFKKRELYSKIGIVFQNPGNQFISQNVLEEVVLSLKNWNSALSEAELKAESEKLLESFGLYSFRKFSPYMLSQGQQRRLAVLSVLSGSQNILLLDEPTYGQDLKSTRTIMELLKEKIKNEGLTVIFVTHDRNLALSYADRIYELENHTFKLFAE